MDGGDVINVTTYRGCIDFYENTWKKSTKHQPAYWMGRYRESFYFQEFHMDFE